MIIPQEEKRIASVLRVSELKKTAYAERLKQLVGNMPKELYLVHTHSYIPPFYYSLPSVGLACEQMLIQAQEELAFFAQSLQIPFSHCVLLTGYFTLDSESQLQRQLVRQLKRPVRLLTLSAQETWLYALGPCLPKQAGDWGRISRNAVNRRTLTQAALF